MVYQIAGTSKGRSMTGHIRKTLTFVETTFIEGGRAAGQPVKLIAAAAVIQNPWAGQGFVENLKPAIHAIAPDLGALLTGMILDAAGGAENVEGYGKAAIVGLNGEVEHASAMIHTLRFGNHYRAALGAKTYLAFTNIRGGANTPVMIPLMDKHDEGRRSHYLTVHFSIPDAPNADEILVALGASTGGRPHHRIGDRYQDLKDLGNDPTNPAAV
jgi:hypothetical protein